MRLEDCLIWRATVKQATVDDIASRANDNVNPTRETSTVKPTKHDHEASLSKHFQIEAIVPLLVKCQCLCLCLHELCDQIKAGTHFVMPLTTLNQIPRCRAAVELFQETLHSIALENHLHVIWPKKSEVVLPSNVSTCQVEQWFRKCNGIAAEDIIFIPHVKGTSFSSESASDSEYTSSDDDSDTLYSKDEMK